MCGLTGFLACGDMLPGSAWAHLLRTMSDTLRHRGPDDDGVWMDVDGGVGLAHRRLSIVDLSPAGHQPMVSPSGRYVIVFNGEVYNHLALRIEMAGSGYLPAFRGHSDTETLLAGFDAWGVDCTIEKTIGMFAFALWDRADHVLTLGRDRLGEKPLYYGWQDDVFLFGSELKALKAHPAFRAEIDRNAVARFLRHRTVAAPYSIYCGIHKLPPGSLLSVSATVRDAAPRRYWDARQVIAKGGLVPFEGGRGDAVDVLERLLSDAIGKQMMGDVAVGAFLSGGVDSSVIVALMQAQSSRPVQTFTIGFHESGYDEADRAKAVARHLGTEHTELYVEPKHALSVIPMLPTLYDEPFADASQIPTFLLSKLTRQHVTVSLSGDAGDELFGGYDRYVFGPKLWAVLESLPLGLRSLISAAIVKVSPQVWNRLLRPFQGASALGQAESRVGDRVHKIAGFMTSSSPMDFMSRLVNDWPDSENLVIGATETAIGFSGLNHPLKSGQLVRDMMVSDLLSFLPDDILTKVDRAAMGVSLETRVPMLDHRVVEFAWSLPLDYKLFNGVGKWPLRQVLSRYVPKGLVNRPKAGFCVPIDDWLRGPLRDWAEDLLSEVRLQSDGYLNPGPIRLRWLQHLAGKRNWQDSLWNVLMFQAWLAEQRK